MMLKGLVPNLAYLAAYCGPAAATAIRSASWSLLCDPRERVLSSRGHTMLPPGGQGSPSPEEHSTPPPTEGHSLLVPPNEGSPPALTEVNLGAREEICRPPFTL